MKKYILIPLLFLASQAHASNFPDAVNSPFESEIAILKESGAVSGYPEDGTYRPDKLINRAEFVKILLLYNQDIAGIGPAKCFTDFRDGGIQSAEWYYAYACEAKALGYIEGYPDGSFGGERYINLAEALKIVMSSNNTPLPQFIQAPKDWYDPYFITADEIGLFNRIARVPSHFVTRGEMAYIFVTISQAGTTPTAANETEDKKDIHEKIAIVSEGETSIDEGLYTITINEESTVILPSGSTITLDGFTFDPKEQYQPGKTIRLVTNMKMHDGGYTYFISGLNCNSKHKWFDDYSILVLSECVMDLEVQKINPQEIKYDNFELRFSSPSDQHYNNNDPANLGRKPITNPANDPFITVVPQYIHLYTSPAMDGYSTGTPIGDTIGIYTAYGYTEIHFNDYKDDILQKRTKKAQIGPLTLSLAIEEISCYAPYLNKEEECITPYGTTVLNKVDFVLSIDQEAANDDSVRISEYNW